MGASVNFEERLRALSEKAKLHAGTLLTEEAAKTALVMPFIAALGYDVFDPREVIPEFIADVGVKKGEKVDYAINHGGALVMLVECKPSSVMLDRTHLSQLYRYFSVTSAKFAILTNGLIYHFFTDLDSSNKLDERPFLVFDLLDIRPNIVVELRKFAKDAFDVAAIMATANALKYVSSVKAEMLKEIDSPSEEMVRLLTSRVYEGKKTASVMAEFAGLTRVAFREIVNDLVRQRLSSALDRTAVAEAAAAIPLPNGADEIHTTDEEMEAFLIIKSIVRQVIAPGRIAMRDQKSYCGILVDNNNRKPLARLHFNRSKKYIGFFDNDEEERIPIETLDDLYVHGDRLLRTGEKYKIT